MGILSYVLPTLGAPRGDEEADVRNALAALQTDYNGNIGTENLRDGGIAEADYGSGTVSERALVAAMAPAPFVPTLKTATGSMVSFTPHEALIVRNDSIVANEQQTAALMYLPRRIVGATRIRWRMASDHNGTGMLAIYSAAGVRIVDTGALANGGTLHRADAIPATTFEAGWYYVMRGTSGVSAGTRTTAHSVRFVNGNAAYDGPPLPNLYLARTPAAGQGSVAPADLSGFAEYVAQGDVGGVPVIALSVA